MKAIYGPVIAAGILSGLTAVLAIKVMSERPKQLSTAPTEIVKVFPQPEQAMPENQTLPQPKIELKPPRFRVPYQSRSVEAPPESVSTPTAPDGQHEPTELKTGDLVMLVNHHGLNFVGIIYDGETLHLPNPTRARVVDPKPREGKIKSDAGVAVIEMTVQDVVEVEVLDGEHRGKRGLASPRAMRRVGSNETVKVDGNAADDVTVRVVRPTGSVQVLVGLDVEPIPPGLGVKDGKPLKGVVVAKVHANSPAFKAGIAVGDVIAGVDGRPTRSVADWRVAWHDFGEKTPKTGTGLMIGARQYIELAQNEKCQIVGYKFAEGKWRSASVRVTPIIWQPMPPETSEEARIRELQEQQMLYRRFPRIPNSPSTYGSRNAYNMIARSMVQSRPPPPPVGRHPWAVDEMSP
jgi:PDZ domain